MTAPTITLAPLTGLADPRLLPWMELYELSFPPSERLLISTMLALALEQSRFARSGAPRDEWLLSALDGDEFVGLVHYRRYPEERLAALWGLATRPELRGRGLGAAIYLALWRRLREEGCRAVLFEVERPDAAEDDARREFAARRIGFYRRMGAQLLTGVEYLQQIGPHQPPVPMHIMAQPAETCSAEDAFAWARALFGDAVWQVGVLGLA